MRPRINQRLDDFQDEEIIFGHQLSIHHFALQIGVTLSDKRGLDDCAARRRKVNGFELVHRFTGNIAASHHFLARATVGTLRTHSPVVRRVSNV
jgi:hypothetical protein